jgi:amino acid adenylation domain-containing protein
MGRERVRGDFDLNIAGLITELHAGGIRLQLLGGELKVKARPGTLTPETVERIRASKTEIVDYLISLGHGAAALDSALEPAIGEGEQVEASPQQRRLAFVAETEESRAYHIVRAYRFADDMNPERLVDALHACIDAHPGLRIVFERIDETLFQRSTPRHPQAVRRMDGVDAAALDALLEEFAYVSMDLGAGPLFRTVVATGGVGCVLAFVAHHLVIDGISIDLLLREIALRCRDEAPEVPSRHYLDYAAYRPRQYAAGPIESDRAYWTEALCDVRREEIVDRDAVDTGMDRSRARRVVASIDSESTVRLRTLLATVRVSPFVGALALLNVCLMRYADAEDVCVGAVSANRVSPEWHSVIGFFANTFAVRTRLSAESDFLDALRRSRDSLLSSLEHQEYPLEEVARIAREIGDTEHGLPFQVVLAFEDRSHPLPVIGGAELVEIEAPQPFAKFDLCLLVIDRGSSIDLVWEYREGRFGDAFMRRLSENMATLAADAIRAPERPLSTLDLLGECDAARLRADLIIRGGAYPRDRTLHSLIEETAAARPDEVALVHRDRRMSYRELDRRANGIAAALLDIGVRGGERIGVSILRSPEQIVAFLGILKAGAAYVPMDPELPAARLDAMREDVAMSICLVADAVPDALRELPLRTLALSACDERDPIVDPPESNAESPCYVLFSSGSTGRPKGIACRHRSVVRLAHQERLTITADTVSLISASMNFDASVLELWPTLIHGGRCVLYPEGVLDARSLGELVRREGIDFIVLTAALFSALADSEPSCFVGVRDLLVGGDVFPPEAGQRVRAVAPSTAMHNIYGPTEATVICTLHRVVDDPQALRVPIGVPTSHDAVLLLDSRAQPVPYGIVGELCVFGDGVAVGYVANPTLDAERFIEHPLCADRSRLYRTGDLARWREDATLEFLGRRDHQVKINGMRIELDEIAAVLATHPGVRECLVRAIADGGRGHRRLVAYCVVNTPAGLDRDALTAHLETRLPSYMLPRELIVLDSIPLNNNGKVDEKRLPRSLRGSVGDDGLDPPVGDTEHTLLALWREVLGTEDIGRESRFYALGGHSLMAVRLVGRINRGFGTAVTVAQFMSDATIAAVARRIDAHRPDAFAMTIPRLDAVHDLVPLSVAQRSLWLHQRLFPDSTAYNVPLAWRIRGPLDIPRLARSIEAIVAAHEPLRTRFVEIDGVPFQRLMPPAPVVLPVEDATDASVADAISAAVAHVHDLELEPPFRARLLRLGLEDHVLLIEMHHLVVDGWSVDLLAAALRDGYAGRLLPVERDLSLRHSDYCFWQSGVAFAERLAAGRAYWKAQLSDFPSMFSLPTGGQLSSDHASDRAPRAGIVRGVLPADLRARVERHAREFGCSVFSVLMSGFSALLHRLGTVDDLVVGTPAANRTERGLESLIGYFVNPLPLRTRTTANTSFDALLKQIDDALRAGLEYQFVPVDEIAAAIGTERIAGRAPIFQTLFDYRRPESGGLSFAGAEVTALRLSSGAPKYDLLFSVDDSPGRCDLALAYRDDMYDDAAMTRLVQGYIALLADALCAPARSLTGLRILDDDENARIAEWSTGEIVLPPCPVPVPETFLAMASASPDATALICRGRSMSYDELASKADAFARAIIAEGAGPGAIVVLVMERSPALVVAMLGALRAGAAYVPLEPGYPRERLTHILRDSSARLMVVDDSGLAAIGDRTDGVRTLTLDALARRSDGVENMALPVLDAAMPAYVIYTSGSTGKPKGVVITHGALANHMRWMLREFAFTSEDRFLFKTPSGFDASVWEIYAPLMCGATMVIAPGNDHRDPFAIVDLLASERVSIVQFVPSLLRACLDVCDEGFLPASLRAIFCGGEPFSQSLLKAARSAAADAVLVNLYGPTEATIDSTFWRSDRDSPGTAATVPIGRPIDNAICVVLDTAGRRVPCGYEGELFIAGAGLAQGYLNALEMTAERFAADFAEMPSMRTYRTGDIVRWTTDGQLIFVRRRDAQVKVRGFRIELEEIDAVLGAHPGIRDAVCVVRDDDARGARIVAFIVLADSSRDDGIDAVRLVSDEALADALRATLPEYMVPAQFVVIDAIPVTPNGKADRAALVATPLALESDPEDRPATTPIECVVASIWQEVLSLGTPPSAVADLFRIGGHSLSASQIVARVRRHFGVQVAFSDFLRTPTVERLAALVEEALRWAAMTMPHRDGAATSDSDTQEQREEFIL